MKTWLFLRKWPQAIFILPILILLFFTGCGSEGTNLAKVLLADLIIGYIGVSESYTVTGQNVELRYAVRNIGHLLAGTTNTGLGIYKKNASGSYDLVDYGESPTKTVNSGDQATYKANLAFRQPGTYKTTLSADAKDAVKEESEFNNLNSQSIIVSGPQITSQSNDLPAAKIVSIEEVK